MAKDDENVVRFPVRTSGGSGESKRPKKGWQLNLVLRCILRYQPKEKANRSQGEE